MLRWKKKDAFMFLLQCELESKNYQFIAFLVVFINDTQKKIKITALNLWGQNLGMCFNALMSIPCDPSDLKAEI